jgi:hypothetical protein
MTINADVTITETSREVFHCLFLAPNAPIGKTWLDSACTPLSDDALQCLALASKIPLLVKARNMYGHFRMASQMKKTSGLYWQPDLELVATLVNETCRLNWHPLQTPLARLQTL